MVHRRISNTLELVRKEKSLGSPMDLAICVLIPADDSDARLSLDPLL